MIKTKKKTTNLGYWFSIGLVGQLLAAPNATVMKAALASIDPTTFNTIRSAICVIIAVPFMIWYWRKINRKNAVYALAAGLCTSVSVTLTTYALQNSQATYVVILSLLSPITLILFSTYFFHEKVRMRAAAGVTLATLGAFVAVALPLVVGGHASFNWYPLATSLILLATIFLPLATIMLRKANEAGLPLTSTQGFSSTIVMVVSFIASFALHGAPVNPMTVQPEVWFGILYNAILVIFIARIMTTSSFERIGAVTTSGFNYLGMIVSLIIPIIFLHETLSIAMVIGGALILLGVYLTEQHHARHPHYLHILRHHG